MGTVLLESPRLLIGQAATNRLMKYSSPNLKFKDLGLPLGL